MQHSPGNPHCWTHLYSLRHSFTQTQCFSQQECQQVSDTQQMSISSGECLTVRQWESAGFWQSSGHRWEGFRTVIQRSSGGHYFAGTGRLAPPPYITLTDITERWKIVNRGCMSLEDSWFWHVDRFVWHSAADCGIHFRNVLHLIYTHQP